MSYHASIDAGEHDDAPAFNVLTTESVRLRPSTHARGTSAQRVWARGMLVNCSSLQQHNTVSSVPDVKADYTPSDRVDYNKLILASSSDRLPRREVYCRYVRVSTNRL